MIGLTPDITAATFVPHGVLPLAFAEGLTADVEVLDRMRGRVFDEVRTPDSFAEIGVDRETGTVTWLGDADLAPYRALIARMGAPTVRARGSRTPRSGSSRRSAVRRAVS